MASRYAMQRVQALLKTNSSILNSNFKLQCRYSSYQNSKKVGNKEEYTSKFEITRLPEDWKYVERLLAPAVVPNPTQKESYPSNWKPPSDAARNGPYFVPRNRNHMIPVYLNSSHRGMRKITEITKIQGDIFELENELKQHLKTAAGRPVATQVNELVGYIHIKGDHVNVVKEFCDIYSLPGTKTCGMNFAAIYVCVITSFHLLSVCFGFCHTNFHKTPPS